MSKSFLQSKTFWVNILALAGMFFIGRSVDAATWAEISVTVLAVINIVLRFVSNEPVTWKATE